MMKTCVMGIDNGVTGSITVLYDDGTFTYAKMPVISQRNYTKTKSKITRVNFVKLMDFLTNISSTNEVVVAVMERPMVNPKRFKASVSAIRCLEATQTALELARIPYVFIDSKEWQKEILPEGTKGPEALKRASDALARKRYPIHNFKNGEGDSVHIAEYTKRKLVKRENQDGQQHAEGSGTSEAA